ncbi:MAG: sulfite exporter TauE/SafE family protein [Desulfurococcales archaeon]|nr:sulfite exporter TauE/SafE family protein [Desulfurococcales archaeon]
MTAIADALTFLIFGILGGFLGSILGIGGGSLMTPLLLAAGYDILVAVPASLLAIVGTSIGGLYVYEEKRLIRYDLAIYAESITIPGSITGVLIASAGFKQVMKITLAAILIIISLEMIRSYLKENKSNNRLNRKVERPVLGFASMYFAGLISALAGTGGGVLKVPILTRLLGMDVKEAVATSKLMVGITGAAGALGYFVGGFMNSCLALSLLAGSLIGGLLGSKTGVKLSGRTIAFLFSGFLMIMAVVVVVRG